MNVVGLTSKVHRIETHLMNASSTGKRDLTHSRHVRQEVKAKEASGRMPNLQNYRLVQNKSLEFLKRSYGNFLRAHKNGETLWNSTKNQPQDTVLFALWAVRVHFMFNSDGQRTNQYEELLAKEYYIVLVKKKQDRKTGKTVLEEVDKECLSSNSMTTY